MSADETDGQLLERFTRGDAAALGVLAARYEGMLLGLARGLLGGRDELAREAVQDAWMRVIRSARGFDARSSFKTWVYRIVINRCHDIREREARQGATDPGGAVAMMAQERGAAESKSHTGRPALNGAFAGLPESKRLILLLCYHRGLTHEQAADVLGIPSGTLKSRLSAALAELRGVLEREAAS